MSGESVRVIPNKLNLFNNARINEVIEMGYDEEYHPIGYNGSSREPIKFTLIGSEHWIDLEKSYIELEFEMSGTGKDGTTKFSADLKAGFVNDIANAVFQTVAIKVNDSPVTLTTEQYQYVSYIQNLLNYPQDFSDNIGRVYLWKKDVAGQFEKLDGVPNTTRKSWVNIADEKLVGIMKVRSPLFSMKQYLMSFLNLDITLDRATNSEFYLLHETGATYYLNIKSAILKVRKLKLLPSFVSGFENFLKNQVQFIEYPLTNAEIITKTYAALGSQLIEDNLFHGTIPSRIICGFVENAAFSGSCLKNPFYFKNMNVIEVSLLVNGLAYPRSAITCDFRTATKNYVNLYHCFLDSLQSTSTTNTNAVNISYAEYGDGSTLFSFDMSPDQYGNINQSMFNVPANVQLKFKFASGNSGAVTLLVYYESLTRMVVNSARQVQMFSK